MSPILSSDSESYTKLCSDFALKDTDHVYTITLVNLAAKSKLDEFVRVISENIGKMSALSESLIKYHAECLKCDFGQGFDVEFDIDGYVLDFDQLLYIADAVGGKAAKLYEDF